METSIADFYKIFFILEIQKLAFNLPHTRILGNSQCVNTSRKELKLSREYHMCCVVVIILREW